MAELNNLIYINVYYSMFVLRKYLSGKNNLIITLFFVHSYVLSLYVVCIRVGKERLTKSL